MVKRGLPLSSGLEYKPGTVGKEGAKFMDSLLPKTLPLLWLALLGVAQPLGGVLLATITAGLGYAIRYWFIEPETQGAACEGGGPWWCPLRAGIIDATQWGVLGIVAAILAVAAIVLAARGQRSTLPAMAAMAVGGAGLTLYNATWSAIAVVAMGLLLSRRPQ